MPKNPHILYHSNSFSSSVISKEKMNYWKWIKWIIQIENDNITDIDLLIWIETQYHYILKKIKNSQYT